MMIRVIFLLLFLTLVSCLDMGDEAKDLECAYNVRIVYRYNNEGTATENMAGWYIRSLDEYIYDANGKLCGKLHIEDGVLARELELAPGNYTLVAWANMTDRNLVSDGSGIGSGANTLDLSWLYPNSFASADPTLTNGGDKLYYGYRTFGVEKDRTSFIDIDMEHAHCELSLTVRWINRPLSKAGLRSGDSYYMLLENAPSRIGFWPDWEINGGIHSYNRDDARYPVYYLNGPLSYLPHINGLKEPLTHRQDRLLSADGQLFFHFITYRLTTRDDGQPVLLSIYDASGRQVMKKIDLYRFFEEMHIDLRVVRRQEYTIVLEIDADDDTVTAFNLQPLDWDDADQLGWN